ncbi:M23/M37 peptidase domain protein [Thermobrachium celere DSM 8682]|uniref:M23/M37 peptidase domain protein n=3 Tax=Thermobrachium TaxID=150333 RepID=R7RS60_9CLOT|nr:M23/M37 peptidase domain protein [Thermobrachium celere DSM 8682]
MKDSDIIQTFSNKVLKKEQKSFSIEVMPVEGNIVRPFGEYVDAKTKKSFFNNGVDIEIKDDLNVRCVFDGKIEKVENTKDNGIVVTISHSGNYKTKYYNISELLKDIGEDVKKGDVIGQIDKEKNKTIHFEVLFNNNFVDPLKLMSTE